MSGVLCLGEALIDAVDQNGEVTEIVGGSLLNVAAGLTALGHEATVGCWIGQDDRGDLIKQYAADRKVALAEGSDAATKTPVAFAKIDAAGHADYTFDLEWDLPSLDDIQGYEHVHTGSIGATLEPGGTKVVAAIKAATNATISYDPNARPALMESPEHVLARVEEIVALSDVVKASDEDLGWLYPGRSYEEVCRDWITRGPRLMVVTRGPDGAAVFVAGDDELHEMSTLPVVVNDTVGAGDSFMAGFISGLLDEGLLGGAAEREALAKATWADVVPAVERAIGTSTVTVGRAGAYGPSHDEIAEALARR